MVTVTESPWQDLSPKEASLQGNERSHRFASVLIYAVVVAASTRYRVAGLSLFAFPLAVLCVHALMAKRTRRDAVADVSVAFLIVGVVLAAVVAEDPSRAIPWAVLAAISTLGLLAAFSSEALARDVLPRAILFAGLVNAGAVVLQRSGHYWISGPPSLNGLNGVTEYYLQAAYFSALGAIVATGRLVGRATYRGAPAFVDALALALTTYGALAGGSRGAAAMLIGGASVVVVLSFATRSLNLPGSGLLLAAVVSILVFTQAANTIVARLHAHASYREQLDSANRHAYQSLAEQIAQSHPLGIGWNGFSHFTGLATGHAVRSTHSLFLSVPLDMGWLGAIGFLALYLIATRRQWVQLRSTARDGTEVVALGLLVAMAIHGVSDTIQVAVSALQIQLAIILWCVTAPLVRFARCDPPPRPSLE
jgi:hypothetical protein